MLARRVGLLALIAVAAIGTAWALLPEAFPSFRSRPAIEPALPGSRIALPSLATPATPPPVPEGPAPAARPLPDQPRFDVARVGSRGVLVTAGRAAPGAEVILLEGEHELGRSRADARGEWVILPGEPLPPGARELALVARSPGGDPVPGRDTVLLVVPDPPAIAPVRTPLAEAGAVEVPAPAAEAASQPLALLLPALGADSAAPRLLQGGGATAEAAAPAAPGSRQQRLGLDVVEYDDAGAMRFAGTAPPGARLRVYVGQEHAGDTVADASGRWNLTPRDQPSIGRHSLRVDQLAAAGTVAARIEVPFQRDRAAADSLVQNGHLVVQPGHNLWRIARRIYGQGVRYTVIYQANREQIRDPRLIYPGQVFAMPEALPQADSSRSR